MEEDKSQDFKEFIEDLQNKLEIEKMRTRQNKEGEEMRLQETIVEKYFETQERVFGLLDKMVAMSNAEVAIAEAKRETEHSGQQVLASLIAATVPFLMQILGLTSPKPQECQCQEPIGPQEPVEEDNTIPLIHACINSFLAFVTPLQYFEKLQQSPMAMAMLKELEREEFIEKAVRLFKAVYPTAASGIAALGFHEWLNDVAQLLFVEEEVEERVKGFIDWQVDVFDLFLAGAKASEAFRHLELDRTYQNMMEEVLELPRDMFIRGAVGKFICLKKAGISNEEEHRLKEWLNELLDLICDTKSVPEV